MFATNRVLDVRVTGARSIVGLKSDRLSDESVIERLFDEVDQFLRGGHCEVLVFDLAGIQALPSSLLGRLVDLRKRVRIELMHTSEYVQLVLETSRLTQFFEPPTATAATVASDRSPAEQRSADPSRFEE